MTEVNKNIHTAVVHAFLALVTGLVVGPVVVGELILALAQ